MRLTKRRQGCVHEWEAGVCRQCGYAMTPDDLRYLAAWQREREGGNGLDEIYRNGGALPEDGGEERPKDLVYEMGMAARHPERLASDLAAMGWDGSVDDPYEHGELERN